jgi:uncharacterized protein (DUF1800 family)
MGMGRRRLAIEAVRSGTVGVLCGLLAVPQALAAGGGSGNRPAPVVRVAPLTQQQRVLHALNRFTFGPRPGDEAAVSRMGLERWFEQQLHPETIDDSAFEARLNMFPAMRLEQADLVRRFPSPAMLRMADKGDVWVPRDPVEKAIYADAEAAYEARLKNVAAQAAASGGAAASAMQADGGSQMQPSGNADGGMQAALPKKQEAQVYAGEQALLSDGTRAPADVQPQSEMSSGQDAAMGPGQGAMPAAVAKKGKGNPKNLSAPMDADEVRAVLELPADQRVQRLVAMQPEEMLAFRAALRPMEKLELVRGLTPAQVETVGSLIAEPVRVVGAEALETRLERDVFSERQLQAVMTDFWLNHFNVYVKKNQNEPYFLPAYERDVILPNALGRFETLLDATAKSPAMLMYLDNWESVGPHSVAAERVQRVQEMRPNGKIAKNLPKGMNENYARELMELHTLGVNGGYTQQDVIEVAKCFTGWTIERPFQGGEAVFNPDRHEPGDKMVLGHKIKENGEREGFEVLHILATSPATAHFISQELAVRFVSDDPPPALVDRMAATFLKTDGDIKAVLLTMFRSPEFWSPRVYRAKVKTPVEFMASALRASGAEVNNPLPLVQAMDRLGMPIYGMQTPNGYSWTSDAWVSSNALISRMNFALVLSSNRLPGTRTDWPQLLGEPDSAQAESEPDTATEKRLEALLLGQPATPRTRETVLAQFKDPMAQQSAEQSFKAKPAELEQDEASMSAGGGRLLQTKAGRDRQMNAPETPLDTMAGLLLGSPEFQRR